MHTTHLYTYIYAWEVSCYAIAYYYGRYITHTIFFSWGVISNNDRIQYVYSVYTTYACTMCSRLSIIYAAYP